MPTETNTARIGQIKDRFLSGIYSKEQAIEQFTIEGWTIEAASQCVEELTAQYKRELFEKAMDRNNDEEMQKVIFIGVLMISIIGPVFEIKSPLWYIVVLLACAGGGYYGFKKKPIAGIVGCVLFAILFPLAYQQYFAHKTSYIRIEMLIPMAMAVIPAFVVYFILKRVFYRDVE